MARYHLTRDGSERDALVREHLPLARSLAARFQHTSENFDDLLQVAVIGLLKAIDRYDPSHATAFTSFAVPTILGDLRRHLRDYTWSVHVPRDLKELSTRLAPAGDRLSAQLGRPPTATELADELGVTDEQVIEARLAVIAHSPASLDAPLGDADDSSSLIDLLDAQDDVTSRLDARLTLERHLAMLPMRDRKILRMRFEQGLMQHEIGTAVGVSQMHVSRLLRSALDALHASMAGDAAGQAAGRDDA